MDNIASGGVNVNGGFMFEIGYNCFNEELAYKFHNKILRYLFKKDLEKSVRVKLHGTYISVSISAESDKATQVLTKCNKKYEKVCRR